MRIEQTTISLEVELHGMPNKKLIFTTMKMLVFGWDHHSFNWEVDSSKTSMGSILPCKECITILAQMTTADKENKQKGIIH